MYINKEIQINKDYFIELGKNINNYLIISDPTFIKYDDISNNYHISFKRKSDAILFSKILAEHGIKGQSGRNKFVHEHEDKRHHKFHVIYLTPDQLTIMHNFVTPSQKKEPSSAYLDTSSTPSSNTQMTWTEYMRLVEKQQTGNKYTIPPNNEQVTAESPLQLNNNPDLTQPQGKAPYPPAPYTFFKQPTSTGPSPLDQINNQPGNKPLIPLNHEEAKTIIQSVSKTIGKFANYETSIGRGDLIEYAKKPAQQFLNQAFGVSNEIQYAYQPLSQRSNGQYIDKQGNQSVTIKSFDPRQEAELKIPGELIDELVNSPKVYVNTDIFKPGCYADAIHNKKFTLQTTEKLNGKSYANLVVGVCLSQQVLPLVTLKHPNDLANDVATAMPKNGIADRKEAVTFLSTPALNFATGMAQQLTKEEQKTFIQGMYRILFHAAISTGNQFIALPPAGLGAFKGPPELYFSLVTEVAKEFPQLNILYNPTDSALFDQYYLQGGAPKNLFKTDRDVFGLALELTRQGYPCAYHNASDVDVVLGARDSGQYWKYGTRGRYASEEHYLSMTTAPCNSFKLNPDAYTNIVECSFAKAKENILEKEEILEMEEDLNPTPFNPFN